jgi:hypothetical protein
MTATDYTLFDAAQAADDAYHVELVRVYGKNACNARYQMTHTDAAVIATGQAKLLASEVWFAEMRRDKAAA